MGFNHNNRNAVIVVAVDSKQNATMLASWASHSQSHYSNSSLSLALSVLCSLLPLGILFTTLFNKVVEGGKIKLSVLTSLITVS